MTAIGIACASRNDLPANKADRAAITNARDVPGKRKWRLHGYVQDVRRTTTSNWSSALPFGPGQRYLQSGPASHILGGWELSAIPSGPDAGASAMKTD